VNINHGVGGIDMAAWLGGAGDGVAKGGGIVSNWRHRSGINKISGIGAAWRSKREKYQAANQWRRQSASGISWRHQQQRGAWRRSGVSIGMARRNQARK